MMKKAYLMLCAALVLIAAVLTAGCEKYLPSLEKSRFTEFTIQTASMEPVFHIGDVIAVDTEFDPKELAVGDIAVYYYYQSVGDDQSGGDKLAVVHRIIEITEKNGTRYYQLKGDNNENPDFMEDELLSEDKIIGKYDHIVSASSR